jgi:hypothetical protein
MAQKKGTQEMELKKMFTHMDTILSADDQVLLATNEDDLQRSTYSLRKVATLFNMEYLQKNQVTALKGRNPIRCKICVNNKITEQVKLNVWATICPTKEKYIYIQTKIQTL